jgi:hypothetical protein
MIEARRADDDRGRPRRGLGPVLRVLFVIAFGALALAEPNPTMGKLWVFLTGVFVGQMYPHKWWEWHRRRTER